MAHRVGIIGGDGIGPEVTAEALKVLRAATPGVGIEETSYDLGARRWHRTGETLPDAVLEEIKGHDAILLGAVGDPGVPSGVLERGLLLRLRFELDHYVNLRPVRLYPGVATPLTAARPETLDMVVVREGTEGPYTGAGGVMRKGTPAEIATQESINTAFGVERVARYAFNRAMTRPRRKLTLVHKTNVLTYAGDLWQRTVDALAKEFADVSVDYCHVDAASMFFVSQPERFDVIVSDLMMPEMTGMALYDEVQRVAADQAERMVFMTGGAFTAAAREFLERVENPRIDKPIVAILRFNQAVRAQDVTAHLTGLLESHAWEPPPPFTSDEQARLRAIDPNQRQRCEPVCRDRGPRHSLDPADPAEKGCRTIGLFSTDQGNPECR